jgi:signal transduction histidine kinase
MKKDNKLRLLYWRLASVFFILILFVGLAYVLITTYYFSRLFNEVNQRINKNTAVNIAKHLHPFNADGKVNEDEMEKLFQQIVSVNPYLEVYLLDSAGQILYFNTDEAKVLLDSVNTAPLEKFIAKHGRVFIKGDDPREPHTSQIFSVARVYSGGRRMGYIYVVLGSDVYNTISKKLERNFFFNIGAFAMLVALFAALVIGLFFIRVLTNNFNRILSVMEKFREGDLNARVPLKPAGSLNEFGVIYNNMADILNENINKLKEIELLRSNLIANISHDLRTPVAIIKGYAETLQIKVNELSEQSRTEYLNRINTSIDKLQKLINELFELSLLETRQMKIKKEPLMISELINDISSSYQLMASEKKIMLNTSLSIHLPLVYADIALIERVIQNLLDNAFRHTPPNGKISIVTKLEKGAVTVTVADTGSGITKQKLEEIYHGFYKENNFSDMRYSTGLGLIIVKKILELHHSNLEINTTEKIGTAFSFSLPLYKK